MERSPSSTGGSVLGGHENGGARAGGNARDAAGTRCRGAGPGGVLGRFGLALLLALGGAPGAGAEIEPVVVSFEEATVRQTSRMSPGAGGAVVYTPLSSRRATLEEIRVAAVGDLDGDGIANLLDACPERADCGSPDGSYAELTAPEPRFDETAPFLVRFADAGELVEAILEENAARESPLYFPEDLIDIAAEAGFPPSVTDAWRATYACGQEVRQRCRARCHSRCEVPRGRRGDEEHEGRGHCLGPCLRRCSRVPRCERPREEDSDRDERGDEARAESHRRSEGRRAEKGGRR